MRNSQKLCLAITFIVGAFWILILHPILLSIVGNPEAAGQSSGAFNVLWLFCILSLAFWFFRTSSARVSTSVDVRKIQPLWWILACLLLISGVLLQLGALSLFAFPGTLLVMLLIISDVLLLFWAPTLLASPRSYRLVVPGAVRLLGGR